MHAEIGRALATPTVRDRFAGIGVEPGWRHAGSDAGFVLEEIERWARVIKETGTTAN